MLINSDHSEPDFIGSHLTFQYNTLTGILQNGNPINVHVDLVQLTSVVVDPAGTEVRFMPPATVPEPASGLIFSLVGALGIALRRRTNVRPAR